MTIGLGFRTNVSCLMGRIDGGGLTGTTGNLLGAQLANNKQNRIFFIYLEHLIIKLIPCYSYTFPIRP